MRLSVLKQYSISLLITLVVLFVCLETYARYKETHGGSGRHVEILYKESFPKISEFLLDKKKLGTGLKYYNYHIFAIPPVETSLVNFTQYFSARKVPASAPIGSIDHPTVWLFGGATMQNLETIDDLTIANQVAVNLKLKGKEATVVNFGVGGFQSSLESIKFQELLRNVSVDDLPDIVIFYDGFNDAGLATIFKAGGFQSDLEKKLEALVEGDHARMFFYSLSNLLGKFSMYWERKLAYKVDRIIFKEEFVNYDELNLIKAVDIYEINAKMIRGICRELGIQPIFLLQPMVYTKKNLTVFEKEIVDKKGMGQKIQFMRNFYRLARERMKGDRDFFDLSSVLDDSMRNDFYDLGHTGPYTGVEIGKRIANIVDIHLQ